MREIMVDAKTAGKKLFRFIKELFPQMRNTEIFKVVRKKVVLVNGQRTDSDYLLKENDKLQLYFKDQHFYKRDTKQDKFINIRMKLDLVFEDSRLLAVSKPRGIVVHPDKINYSKTLIEGVKAYLYRKHEYSPEDSFTPACCNRLDANTSGVVIIAKTQTALQEITAAFRERTTTKTYLALCYGKIIQKMLLVSMIDASPNRDNIVNISALQKKLIIPEKEKFLKENPSHSATLVEPIKSAKNVTLVKVDLWTGKKHQIRAQLSAAGFPLIGDSKYQTSQSQSSALLNQVDHYYLHCQSISFNQGEIYTAPLSEDFKQKIKELLGIEYK